MALRQAGTTTFSLSLCSAKSGTQQLAAPWGPQMEQDCFHFPGPTDWCSDHLAQVSPGSIFFHQT